MGEKPSCRICKHLIGKDKKKGSTICDAFAGGIPFPILTGDFNHKKKWQGDKGIRFSLSQKRKWNKFKLDNVVSFKDIMPSELKKPQACRDYVRREGRWLFQGREVPLDVAKRLNKMGVPPAWRDVVVSTDKASKIQVMGLDKAGRWQYRYSKEHIKASNIKKFDRVKLFKNDMPDIRKRIAVGMDAGDSRAYLLQLENKTAIRMGSVKDVLST